MARMFQNSALDSLTSSVNLLHQRQRTSEEGQMKMMQLNSQLATEQAERDLLPRRLKLEEERIGHQLNMEKAGFSLEVIGAHDQLKTSALNRSLARAQENRASKLAPHALTVARLNAEETQIRFNGLPGLLMREADAMRAGTAAVVGQEQRASELHPFTVEEAKDAGDLRDIELALREVTAETEASQAVQMQILYGISNMAQNAEPRIAASTAATEQISAGGLKQDDAMLGLKQTLLNVNPETGAITGFKNKGFNQLFRSSPKTNNEYDQTPDAYFNSFMNEVLGMASKKGNWIVDGEYQNPSTGKRGDDLANAAYSVVKPRLLHHMETNLAKQYKREFEQLNAIKELLGRVQRGEDRTVDEATVATRLKTAENNLLTAVTVGLNGEFKFGKMDASNNVKANIYQSLMSPTDAPAFARNYTLGEMEVNGGIVNFNNSQNLLAGEVQKQKEFQNGQLFEGSTQAQSKFRNALDKRRGETQSRVNEVAFVPEVYKEAIVEATRATNPKDVMKAFLTNPSRFGFMGIPGNAKLAEYMFGNGSMDTNLLDEREYNP